VSAILVLRDLVVAVPSRRAPIQVSLAPDPDQDKPAVLTAVDADEASATALARTVAGLVKPLSGRVVVDGKDVTEKSPGARQIGYVPTGGALLPHLTVRQNIEYLIWRQETVHDLVRTWQAALVHHLELGPVLDLRPHEITPQQRMRGAIARAVLSSPEVLVFDLPDASTTGPLRDLLAGVVTAGAVRPSTVVFTGDGTLLAEADRVVRAEAVVGS
jgi:ABC-type sulfate/molybdate transport systems ATPase subunit